MRSNLVWESDHIDNSVFITTRCRNKGLRHVYTRRCTTKGTHKVDDVYLL